MREIKFRAWDNFFKQMYYFDFENNIEVRSGHLWIVHEEGAISSKSPSIKIMQYTELKDKNGTEIYEGDIVKVKDIYSNIEYVGFVDFADASFIIKTSYMSAYRWMDYEVEILGNVYENQELLEEEEKC